MNEKEKKAIDYFSKKVDKLKENLEKGLYYGEQYQVREDIKHLETVLNLIEKQQVEIEDLKKSVDYTYEAYQDAGKKMFEYAEEIDLNKKRE